MTGGVAHSHVMIVCVGVRCRDEVFEVCLQTGGCSPAFSKGPVLFFTCC